MTPFTHGTLATAVLAPAALALAGLITLGGPLAAQQGEFPTTPPPPAPLSPPAFPPFQEATLSNGLRLVLVQSDRHPVLSLSLAFPAGAAHDPAGKEGLASIVANLLDKGAGQRGAEEIAAAIEGVGGSLAAGAGNDFLTVGANVLSAHAELAFSLLGDVVRRPTFPESELELARTQTLSGLQLQLTQPASLAQRFFDRELYGAHPYGRSPTPASVRAITRADLVAFHQARLRPRDALLVIAGDIDLARARQLAEQAFRGWTGAPPRTPEPPAPPVRGGTEIVLVHRPGSVQANIVAGNTTFGPADERRYATVVANRVLGGGGDARLFMILREQRGWTYGASSSLTRPLGIGAFTASTEVRNEVADSALTELLVQLREIRREPVSSAELEQAKSALVGSFPLTIETAQQVAGAVSQARRLNLPEDYLQTYRQRLAAITAAQLQQAATSAIRPDSALVVVVGDATVLHQRLSAIAPVRMINVQGDPLTVADLAPPAGGTTIDVGRLAVRRDSFAILVQGNPFGFQSVNLERTEDGWRMTEQTQLGPIAQQQSTVLLGQRGELREVTQTGRVQGQEVRVDVSVGGGRAIGTAVAPNPQTGQVGPVTVDVELPDGTLDENAMVALLPALPWAPNASITVPVFSAGQNAVRQITFAVTGTELVNVPAGELLAFRVDMTGGQQPATLWIEQAAPHRLMKLAPMGAPIEIVRVQ